ncbi:LOW QUALITY PROTEIN: uncharacterized protein LOC129080339 [Pteronotus mesoamericanus]|uniref:LOW QUALITY PROTEIN: uncharacterized protein LOC129080339 n=1 Tax=Pteronotus mesoamericanus TaxID=1884717 RepID=UPI0023ED485F|nr:LOW QUALITY PROTEIN: uncharacterized protein LOC129080339 [Pteronotus parnellii mesoamericanus]
MSLLAETGSLLRLHGSGPASGKDTEELQSVWRMKAGAQKGRGTAGVRTVREVTEARRKVLRAASTNGPVQDIRRFDEERFPNPSPSFGQATLMEVWLRVQGWGPLPAFSPERSPASLPEDFHLEWEVAVEARTGFLCMAKSQKEHLFLSGGFNVEQKFEPRAKGLQLLCLCGVSPTSREERRAGDLRDQEASPQSAARTVPRRRRGYCECCQEDFEELRGHLQSAQHQGSVLEAHPYAEVNWIITQLSHSFVDTPSQESLPRQSDSSALDCNLLCPETLSPIQPTCGRAASPRVREEDDPQAPGSPDRDGVVGCMEAPAECVGAGEVPRPAGSCQDLWGSADITMDPPGALVSRSPTCQCLPTSCGFADLPSGPDSALVGHKRKVQFPSGNAEGKPGVSWPQASSFVPRTLSPCGTWTTDGRQFFSLPLPGHEPRPLTSLLPLCPQQTSLSLPDPLPWQLPGRPAEPWATPPPGPGGGHSPGSEGPECAGPSLVSEWTDRPPSCSAASGQLAGQLARQLHSAAGT